MNCIILLEKELKSFMEKDYDKNQLMKDNMRSVVVIIESYNKATIKTIDYAKTISNDLVGFHVSVDEVETEELIKMWQEYKVGFPLVVRKSRIQDVVNVLREYIGTDSITVVMTHLVVEKWWQKGLHNELENIVKEKLSKQQNVLIISVPYQIRLNNEYT